MRLISICPSLTELVFDLGAGHELVGRTKFCIHPAEGVASVETLGGTKNPKTDRVVALEPDLVLMNEEENRIEDAEALRAAGIAVHTSLPRTADETAAMVRSIGDAIGRREAAARIADDIASRAADVRSRASGRAPVTYAYLIWRRPYMTLNDDTYVGGLLGLAGGENVFGAAGDRYPEITAEDLARTSPERVLLSSEPFPFADRHADELAELTGLARDRFRLVDGELLSWHGSRTIRGIGYAEEVVQG